ncbi:MFS transporter [Paraburkholderia sp.]|uniref:MFS transporter n=1 Tax=Paraburkholderia sp. TaxID=1926495 RepID=UPI002F3F75C2
MARRVLCATSISYTIVLLDASIVNVALEQIGSTLRSNVAGLQWVVNAYTLSFATLLLTGGTLGDRLGAKPVYLAGLAVFALASALCGFAPNLLTLTLARALQGVGSAMLVPCSLALINRAFPDPAAKASAVGVWMGCGGIAMASGPLLGGILIHWLGWRSIFVVNVPIALAGVWLTRSVNHEAASQRGHFDVAGQASAIVALGTLIAVLIEGPTLGWRMPLIASGACVSCAAWIAFFVIEKRRAHPMLPLSFFTNPLFSASTTVSMASALVFYGLLFIFSIGYQTMHGYSPLETGLAFLPMTAMVAAGGLTSNRIVKLCGPRAAMCAAFTLYAAGSLTMLAAPPAAPYWLAIAPMLAIGLAAGFISPAATSPAMGTVDTHHAGVAAAVLNSARQSGAALGVAIFGGFITAVQPFASALRVALATAAVVALMTALLWWIASDTPPGRAKRRAKPLPSPRLRSSGRSEVR